VSYMRTSSGLYLPSKAEAPKRYSRPIAIELFAGAGGMSVGFHQAGFHVVAALEMDYWAAITYMTNLAHPGVKIHFDTKERQRGFEQTLARHLGVAVDSSGRVQVGGANDLSHLEGKLAGSGWISSYDSKVRFDPNADQFDGPPVHPDGCEHFWIADIRNTTGEDILNAIGVEQGSVDVVVGGPPCQGYSRAGEQDVMDPRNSLVFEFARLVLEIRPKAFMMENVPGMLDLVTPEGIPVIDALCRVFDDGGFGAYDAIKKSLLVSAGAGAAMRSREPSRPASDDTEGRQPGLFDEAIA
jgi:DNA (cytosine-5)-methyltransferase 1